MNSQGIDKIAQLKNRLREKMLQKQNPEHTPLQLEDNKQQHQQIQQKSTLNIIEPSSRPNERQHGDNSLSRIIHPNQIPAEQPINLKRTQEQLKFQISKPPERSESKTNQPTSNEINSKPREDQNKNKLVTSSLLALQTQNRSLMQETELTIQKSRKENELSIIKPETTKNLILAINTVVEPQPQSTEQIFATIKSNPTKSLLKPFVPYQKPNSQVNPPSRLNIQNETNSRPQSSRIILEEPKVQNKEPPFKISQSPHPDSDSKAQKKSSKDLETQIIKTPQEVKPQLNIQIKNPLKVETDSVQQKPPEIPKSLNEIPKLNQQIAKPPSESNLINIVAKVIKTMDVKQVPPPDKNKEAEMKITQTQNIEIHITQPQQPMMQTPQKSTETSKNSITNLEIQQQNEKKELTKLPDQNQKFLKEPQTESLINEKNNIVQTNPIGILTQNPQKDITVQLPSNISDEPVQQPIKIISKEPSIEFSQKKEISQPRQIEPIVETPQITVNKIEAKIKNPETQTQIITQELVQKNQNMEMIPNKILAQEPRQKENDKMLIEESGIIQKEQRLEEMNQYYEPHKESAQLPIQSKDQVDTTLQEFTSSSQDILQQDLKIFRRKFPNLKIQQLFKFKKEKNSKLIKQIKLIQKFIKQVERQGQQILGEKKDFEEKSLKERIKEIVLFYENLK